MKFSIICASHDDNVLKQNLLQSPQLNEHELIIIKRCKEVSKAYNEASLSATCTLQIFVHHDVYLPLGFFDSLTTSIVDLPISDWGLLGVAGKSKNDEDVGFVLDRDNEWGDKDNLPQEARTLDELLLVKQRDEFLFDEKIPSTHHLFGSDLCLQYSSKGYRNFAISAVCRHNSDYDNKVPESWFESAKYLRKKWSAFLPIPTTCGLIFADKIEVPIVN